MSHFGVESRNADGTIVYRGGYFNQGEGELQYRKKMMEEEKAKKHDPNAPAKSGLEVIFQFLHQLFSGLFFAHFGNHEKNIMQKDENVAKYFAQLEKEPDTMLEQGLTFEKLKDKANSMISDIEKGKSIRDIQVNNTINNRVNFEKDKLVEPLKSSGASEKAVETITSNNKAISDRMHHIEAMKEDLKEYSNLWFETKDKDKMMKDDMTLSKSLIKPLWIINLLLNQKDLIYQHLECRRG